MWFFRLPPILYLLLAPLMLAGAGYLFYDHQNKEAEKAVARAAPAPALVKIEAFDPARNTGAAHEVNVLGQVDVSQMMEVTRSKRRQVKERWLIAPVYPTTAVDGNAPAIGVFLQHGDASEDQLIKLKAGDGPFAPILRLNGTLLEPGADRQALDEVTDQIKIAPNAIYIDPFEQGRGAGLAASTGGRDAAIALAVLALLVAAWGEFQRRRQRRIREEDGY
jgi:hypothetical protein